MLTTDCPNSSFDLPSEYRLHRACWLGQVAEVKDMLRQGCSPNFSVGGKSCLLAAMQKGHLEVGWQLLHFGADPNEIVGRQRNALLHIAARTGNYGFASLLLENGANPNAVNAIHQVPLHLASRGGVAFLVDDLLKHGASPDTRDSSGNTPLDIAAKAGHTEVCKTLLKRGSPIDLTNCQGNTPYQSARIAGYSAAAEMLAAYGADASTWNGTNNSAQRTPPIQLAAGEYQEHTR